MKTSTLPSVLLILLVISTHCTAATGISSFAIGIGGLPKQIGFTTLKGDDPFRGPIAFNEHEGSIFILDEVNRKVAVYTHEGQFIKSYAIPSSLQCSDLVVDSRGSILLLSRQGVFQLADNGDLIKARNLPKAIKLPLFAYVDLSGVIAIQGMRNDGTTIIGLLALDGTFKELKGQWVVSSHLGLLGVREGDMLSVIRGGRVVAKMRLRHAPVLIGLSDDMKLYSVEPSKEGMRIHQLSPDGRVVTKQVEFNSPLIVDETSYPTYFRVIKNGEVAVLDTDASRCKVTIVRFQ